MPSPRWVGSARPFAAKPGEAPPVVPRVDLPATTASEAAAKRLLASAGLEIVPEQACATAEEAVAAAERLGFPVVMKILSPDILHKSEIGGVLVGVADAAAVRDGYATLTRRAKEKAAGCANRRRAGGTSDDRWRGVHHGHPGRSGVRTGRDVRARRDLRGGDEGCGVPPLSVRGGCGGGDDPLDPRCAAAVGCARPSAC